jgi:hypothetical protein
LNSFLPLYRWISLSITGIRTFKKGKGKKWRVYERSLCDKCLFTSLFPFQSDY